MREYAPLEVAQQATEKTIRTRTCPWCEALAGELCHLQPGQGIPAISRTHLGRFPTNIEPADFLLLSDEYAATIP